MTGDLDGLAGNTTAQAFLIGRDVAGHWLAVEVHGRGGGIFSSRRAALDYARGETNRRPGAIADAGRPIVLR